ncbi:MAG: DMT family transporter [Bacillota bacterium]
MNKRKLSGMTAGAVLVAVSALGFSTNPIFGKLGYQAGATPVTLLATRFVLAALSLWLYLLWRRQTGGVPVLKRAQLIVLGSMGMAMVSMLYFSALPYIDAGLATGIFYLHPAMIALVGLFRGERLGRMGLAGLLLTGAGTWLLLGTGTGAGGFTLQGLLMITGAAALYAAYIIMGERWTQGVSPIVSSAHVTLGAAVVYLSIAPLTGQSLPPPGAIAYGAALALTSTVLALITLFAGLPKVGPTRAAIISTLEPVFTVILAAILLGERLSWLQQAGIVMVVIGAITVQMRDRPTAAVPEM